LKNVDALIIKANQDEIMTEIEKIKVVMIEGHLAHDLQIMHHARAIMRDFHDWKEKSFVFCGNKIHE